MPKNNGEMTSAEKALDLEALGKSVVSTPLEESIPSSTYILWVASAADGIEPWGKNVKTRDKQLRDFILTENFLLSALGIICSRNIAFSWTLDGPPRTVKLYQDILQNANLGAGWGEFIAKVSLDLYTQDMGAFVEIIRQDNGSPTSPVIGINHLDAGRCWPTGNAEVPVVYVDREGIYHSLKQHQVVNLHEMPSAIEHPSLGPLYSVQYCAVTRLLKAAQILRNITIYKEEKTGGRFNRAVHLVKGVTSKQISDAFAEQQSGASGQGLMRYIQPLMVSSVSPTAEIGHDTIELATMPDGFDEEVTFKHYISAIAMAFFSDYQEFAPLPGGGLGTSAQSEVLHMKTRGKGPALFQKLITRLMNFQGVLPQNVEFKFEEQDLEGETAQAALSKIRAEERAVRIASTEITPAVARQLARDSGDLAPEIFDAMGGLDLTSHVTLEDVEKPKTPEEAVAPEGATLPAASPPPALTAAPVAQPPKLPAGKKSLPDLLEQVEDLKEDLNADAEPHRTGPEEIETERLDVEQEVKAKALRALQKMQKRIQARIKAEKI